VPQQEQGRNVLIIALSAGLVSGMVFSLVAVGAGLLRQTSNYFNLAQGGMAMFAAYFGYIISQHTDSLLLIALGCLGAGIVAGLAVFVILRRLFDRTSILPALVVTLAINTILEEAMRITVNSGLPVALPENLVTQGNNFLSVGQFSGLWALIAVVAICVGFYIWLKRSRTGLAIRSVGWSRERATIQGIRVGRIDFFVAAMSGLFAGLAGFLIALFYGSITPYVADPVLFVALAAILLAGSSNVLAIAGIGLVLGAIDGIASFYAFGGQTELISLVIIIVVLVGRPAFKLITPKVLPLLGHMKLWGS
jgi:branched-chain amino acid transport system permease protein